MVRLVFCLRRRSGWTEKAFHDYWADMHGPLVRRHADVLRIRRYVQLHPTEPATSGALAAIRGGPAPFDGIAELWFDSAADIEAAADKPEARAAARELVEDESHFIDLERSPIWLFDEVTS